MRPPCRARADPSPARIRPGVRAAAPGAVDRPEARRRRAQRYGCGLRCEDDRTAGPAVHRKVDSGRPPRMRSPARVTGAATRERRRTVRRRRVGGADRRPLRPGGQQADGGGPRRAGCPAHDLHGQTGAGAAPWRASGAVKAAVRHVGRLLRPERLTAAMRTVRGVRSGYGRFPSGRHRLHRRAEPPPDARTRQARLAFEHREPGPGTGGGTHRRAARGRTARMCGLASVLRRTGMARRQRGQADRRASGREQLAVRRPALAVATRALAVDDFTSLNVLLDAALVEPPAGCRSMRARSRPEPAVVPAGALVRQDPAHCGLRRRQGPQVAVAAEAQGAHGGSPQACRGHGEGEPPQAAQGPQSGSVSPPPQRRPPTALVAGRLRRPASRSGPLIGRLRIAP